MLISTSSSLNITMRSGAALIGKVAFGLLVLSTISAANQIANGDFSFGNASFSSSYTLVQANGTVHTEPGDYGLTTNPGTGFTNGYNSYSDHTGDGAGLMLLVDGYAPGTIAWSESVSVSPSTTYTFTGWVASADNENLAALGLFVNGSQVGASFNPPAAAGIWTEWQETWTAGSSDSEITLSIQDLNTNYIPAGNDFTLDDLSLDGASTTATPEPASLPAMGLAAIAGLILLRRARS